LLHTDVISQKSACHSISLSRLLRNIGLFCRE